jgi:hypothetical protein
MGPADATGRRAISAKRLISPNFSLRELISARQSFAIDKRGHFTFF